MVVRVADGIGRRWGVCDFGIHLEEGELQVEEGKGDLRRTQFPSTGAIRPAWCSRDQEDEQARADER